MGFFYNHKLDWECQRLNKSYQKIPRTNIDSSGWDTWRADRNGPENFKLLAGIEKFQSLRLGEVYLRDWQLNSKYKSN